MKLRNQGQKYIKEFERGKNMRKRNSYIWLIKIPRLKTKLKG